MKQNLDTKRSGITLEEAEEKLASIEPAKEAFQLASFLFNDQFTAKHVVAKQEKNGHIVVSFVACKDDVAVHWGYSQKDAMTPGKMSWRINSKKASQTDVLNIIKKGENNGVQAKMD